MLRCLGLFLILVGLPAFQGEKDANASEKEVHPRKLIAMGRLLEGEESSQTEALEMYIRAWESGQLLSGEERGDLLKRMSRLRKMVKPKRKMKPRQWNVLSVVIQNVDLKWTQRGAGKNPGKVNKKKRKKVIRKKRAPRKEEQGQEFKYRVGTGVLGNLKKGFDQAIKRLNRLAPDRVRFRGELKIVRESLEALEGDKGGDPWVSPEILSGLASLWNRGKYHMVLVSLVNAPPGEERIPFSKQVLLRPGVDGVGYANLFWYPEDAEAREPSGEREISAIFNLLRSAILRGGGYDPVLLPKGNSEEEGKDPDYVPPAEGDRAAFPMHLLESHVTEGMWKSAGFHAFPKGPFLKEWRISDLFSPEERRGELMDRAWIDEKDAGKLVPEWKIITSRKDAVDFRQESRGKKGPLLLYAALYLYARKACHIRFWSRSSGECRVLLNGNFISENPPSEKMVPVRLDLEKGTNLLLIKNCRKWGMWYMEGRIADDKGNMPDDVFPSLAPR